MSLNIKREGNDFDKRWKYFLFLRMVKGDLYRIHSANLAV